MLTRDSFPRLLENKIVLLTGAGGGIGTEAALAFAAMGARVILAEINPDSGRHAESEVNGRYPNQSTVFYEVDLSDESQVRVMSDWIVQNIGVPDVVFNNATITKMGAVDQVESTFWDKSYAINLKAPLILAQHFLPLMKNRKSGSLVFVSSSGAAPYMGAYEVFKTAQVELSNTLAMELEGTGVSAYTIGPGLVKTETAMKSIEIVAKSMDMTTDAFYEMNSQHIIGADLAGLGFALSTSAPQRYHGQEIGCIQVLMDFGAFSSDTATQPAKHTTSAEQKTLFARIQATFSDQYVGWQKMNVFERQWVFRDFKKCMGISAEQAGDTFRLVQEKQNRQEGLEPRELAFFQNLKKYWEHQLQLLQGYEKSAEKLEDNTRIITGWIDDINRFLCAE